MAGRFLADPVILRSEGSKELAQSEQFKNTVDKIFSTLNQMMASDYLSPAAKVLAERISAHKGDLVQMQNIIADYGNYCIMASNKVSRNEQDIMDEYRI